MAYSGAAITGSAALSRICKRIGSVWYWLVLSCKVAPMQVVGGTYHHLVGAYTGQVGLATWGGIMAVDQARQVWNDMQDVANRKQTETS